MSKFANPWSGIRTFTKGHTNALSKTADIKDRDYQKHCARKKKMGKEPMSYTAWCKQERRKRGMF
jgi:hypothetical protein